MNIAPITKQIESSMNVKVTATVKAKAKLKSQMRAFTLIETFVAVSVIMTALVGPLTLSQKSLALSGYSRDKMTAYYLAQDAVEYIRGIRDDNAKQGRTWAAFIGTQLDECRKTADSAGCRVNSALKPDVPESITACSTTCTPMSYNTATGLYVTDAPTQGGPIIPSIFTRTVTISAPPYDAAVGNEMSREVFITVRMDWNNDGIAQTYTVVQDLFDW